METRSRMSRSLHTNRDFEKLEPYEGKPSRTVLRGEEGSNALDLPDRPSDLQQRDGRGVRAGNEIAKHFAGNNVDVIIYAVEKSLDSYKFNLLHCKQTFISQLKSGAMGARTIDEGAMDEKSGMNFSEYMAVAVRQYRPAWTRRNWRSASPRSKGNASRSTRASVNRSSSWSPRQASSGTTQAVIDCHDGGLGDSFTADSARPTRRATA